MIDRFFPFSGHNSTSILLGHGSDSEDKEFPWWEICLDVNGKTLVYETVYADKDRRFGEHGIESSREIIEEIRTLGQKFIDFANDAERSLEALLAD